MLDGLMGLLDNESVRRTLRALSALALLLAAPVAIGRLRDPGSAVGGRLWRRLAPLGRRLLPVNMVRPQQRQQIAFGLVGHHLYGIGQVFAFGGELDHGRLT